MKNEFHNEYDYLPLSAVVLVVRNSQTKSWNDFNSHEID